MFCQECIQRGSEVAIGEGKTQLRCLGQCDQDFKLATLQKALKPHIYAKWIKQIQAGELEQAGIEGLEQCPFCPFATIMESSPEENKVFSCQNPDCGKESCRLCHEPSHIPKKCEEVENDSEVRKRTYIENKMSEALMRKCWKCNKPFVKLDGCNKMTCQCGAQMCYIFRQPVEDYDHFYDNEGYYSSDEDSESDYDGYGYDYWDPHGVLPQPQTHQEESQPGPSSRCPLFSDDSAVHDRVVAQTAAEAKKKMEEEKPEVRYLSTTLILINSCLRFGIILYSILFL